jgi:hypothetical protein
VYLLYVYLKQNSKNYEEALEMSHNEAKFQKQGLMYQDIAIEFIFRK